jgi:lipoyl(octanoyl) transferase
MLDHLTLWLDEKPRDGALNMALDEVMLLSAEGVWMRVYRWDAPTISIGFSQPATVVPSDKAAWPVVRRWTGGGVVEHDGDWTYTLAAPGGHPLCEQRAAETYRWIHEAMIRALEEVGVTGAELQPESTSDGMGVCFVEPAKYDVVLHGQKIAGAAQRRVKVGFLHQGTIQPVAIPEGFGLAFARALAADVYVADHATIKERLMPQALELAGQKYGAPEWLQDRSLRRSEASV